VSGRCAIRLFAKPTRAPVLVFVEPIFTSVFVLPLVGPAAATAVVLALGSRHRVGPALLALLLLVPTFLLAQCLLSAVGWCLMPLSAASATPAYLPWYAELLLAPACYLYLVVLSSEPLRQPRAWRQLLPGLGQVGLFAGVAVLGLGYRQVMTPAAGPPSDAVKFLGHLVAPLALLSYGLLLRYGLQALEGYRRYHLAESNDPAGRRLPIAQHTLVWLLLLGFGLGLSFVALDAWFGPFAYSELWYTLTVRGGLVFGLAVVGLQTSYALASRSTRAAGYQANMVLAVAHYPTFTLGKLPSTEAERPIHNQPLHVVSAPPTPTLPAELLPWRVQLLALMDEERPWLEPELTLAELAQRLGTHATLLSKVINMGCGQNFNDFVNSYRVAEARRLLANPQFAHYSLVGVALESGFNSKSTFNRVFKKLDGRAPSEVTRLKL
jgi:AraC-like DNA-binding protein